MPGPQSSDVSSFFQIGDKIVFHVRNGVTGAELWTTDGTSAGTVFYKTINPAGISDIFVELNDKLYFVNRPIEGVPTGEELWVTDGTPAGTMLVKDIRPGTQSSNITNLTAVDGRLYFGADTGDDGRELWQSDGTEAGTFRIADIAPGAASSNPGNFNQVNGLVVFTASIGNTIGRELWATDGTAEGTRLVKDIYPLGNVSSDITNMHALGQKLYFFAADPVHGKELWTTDGTTAGTHLVKDINEFGSSLHTSSDFDAILFKDELFFVADDGMFGRELWKTDGTADGTQRISNISSLGHSFGNSTEFIEYKGRIYFSASDGLNGFELYASDGTAAGTVLIKDIVPGMNSGSPRGFLIVDDLLFFRTGAAGADFYVSDGTAEGTRYITDFIPGFHNQLQAFDPIEKMLIFGERYGTPTIGDDALAGDSGGNTINGLQGNDIIHGHAGNDFLFGGDGNDELYGGDGADVLFGETGNDFLDGGRAVEIRDEGGNLVGGQGNILVPGPGNNKIHVHSTLDIVDNGAIYTNHPGRPSANNDITSFTDFWWDLYGAGSTLRISETIAQRVELSAIIGSVFDSEIFGNTGNNIIFTVGGNNFVSPSDGIDYIALGNLPGFRGVDTIVLEKGQSGAPSWAAVWDFMPGEDKIDVSAYGYGSFGIVQLLGFDDGAGNSFYAFGENASDILFLVGLEKADLSAGDFIV